MKKTKEQKAITLVALLVTIVVLLILALVTLREFTEGEFIAKANNATSTFNKAQANEILEINKQENVIDKHFPVAEHEHKNADGYSNMHNGGKCVICGFSCSNTSIENTTPEYFAYEEYDGHAIIYTCNVCGLFFTDHAPQGEHNNMKTGDKCELCGYIK